MPMRDYLWISHGQEGGPSSGINIYDPRSAVLVGSVAAPTNYDDGGLELFGRMAAVDTETCYVSGSNTVFKVDVATRAVSDWLTWPRYFWLIAPSGGNIADGYITRPDYFALSPDGTKVWGIAFKGGFIRNTSEMTPPALPKPYWQAITLGGDGTTTGSEAPVAFLFEVDVATSTVSSPFFVAYGNLSGRQTNFLPGVVTGGSGFECSVPSIIFSPDGAKAYIFGNNNNTNPDGTTDSYIYVIDTATKATIAAFDLTTLMGASQTLYQFVLSADGSKLFITRGSKISTIDTTTGALISSVSVYPSGGTPSNAGPFDIDAAGLLAPRVVAFIGMVSGALSYVDTRAGGGSYATTTNLASINRVLAINDPVDGPSICCLANSAYHLAFGTTATTVEGAGGWDVLPFPGTIVDANAVSGTGFRHDAFLRPSYLTAGSSGVALLTTKDAAHTWDSYTVTSGAAADASLLIDPLTNSFRALYTNTPSGSGSGVTASFFTATASKDGEQGDWSASASVATLTGAFPVAAQHPQDSTRAACLTLDSGTLKAWVSYDTGATWNALNASVATGLDFSSSGRAGLCWLGECLCAVYASGNNLLAKVSTDGGHTWPGSAVTVASGGPYSGVSCAGLLGTLYAMANTATATKVFTSGDLGAAWAATAADPTAQASGTALGFVPETGRLLVGTSLYSADNGATWNTD